LAKNNDDGIMIPNLCEKHAVMLVAQSGYQQHEPWRAMMVASNIALFQFATTKPRTHELIGKDISRVGELGCLACYSPDAFGQIVEVAKSHDIRNIRLLGEKWIADESANSSN